MLPMKVVRYLSGCYSATPVTGATRQSWPIGLRENKNTFRERRGRGRRERKVSLLRLSPFFASIFPLFPQKRLILRLAGCNWLISIHVVDCHYDCQLSRNALFFFCNQLCLRGLGYRAFSFTWPATMQMYWNKRKSLHKKRVQLPQDWFGTPTWPPFYDPFIVLGHRYGRHDVRWKRPIVVQYTVVGLFALKSEEKESY